MAEGVAKVVKHFPNMHKALSSIPSTARKKEEEKKKKKNQNWELGMTRKKYREMTVSIYGAFNHDMTASPFYRWGN
jgi:hypothetical protein